MDKFACEQRLHDFSIYWIGSKYDHTPYISMVQEIYDSYSRVLSS